MVVILALSAPTWQLRKTIIRMEFAALRRFMFSMVLDKIVKHTISNEKNTPSFHKENGKQLPLDILYFAFNPQILTVNVRINDAKSRQFLGKINEKMQIRICFLFFFIILY